MGKTKNLVVVESPTKTKSINRYLGSDYEVVSSKGHIIDLPKSDLGIDVDHNYQPQYTPMQGKKKVISDLKKDAKDANVIYLATDLDREGEAIAWHIVSALDGLDKDGKIKDTNKFKRVIFPEITKDTVIAAFKNPRGFDYHLIDAYQARRVLDRLVGYKLSPLLWKKIQYGLSAGRVQSVAVRLIVERENEREQFKSTPYYKIIAELKSEKTEPFTADLTQIKEEKIERKHTLKLFAGEYTYSDTILESKKVLEQHLTTLKKHKHLIVLEIKSKEVKNSPAPPFTTASLQRAALTNLNLSAKQTMSIAQKLYEEGYITYHRTDSTNLSKDFTEKAKLFIEKEYGKQYLPESPRVYKTKNKAAQEAHEAIRPTSIVDHVKTYAAAKEKFGTKEADLYDLIYKRALASQAASARYRKDTITFITPDREYMFQTGGSVILFDGFLKIVGTNGSEDTIIPPLSEGDEVPIISINNTDHTTSPPPRYNEASLIKDLELHEIGRPSTYSPIIDTIQARGYVIKENNAFVPEDTGTVVNKLLVENFPEIVDLQFTAQMEDNLDRVAGGELDWVKEIDTFFKPFENEIEKADKNLTRDDYKILAETNEKCPECEYKLVLKLGKYGKFYSCSNFPECKYAKPYIDKIGMPCFKCKDGEIIVRRSGWGKKFFGCTNYPNCDWASWKDPRSPNYDDAVEQEKRAQRAKRKKNAPKKKDAKNTQTSKKKK